MSVTTTVKKTVKSRTKTKPKQSGAKGKISEKSPTKSKNTSKNNSVRKPIKKKDPVSDQKTKKKRSTGTGKSTSKEAVKVRQSAFLKALSDPACQYNITLACMRAEISRGLFYQWRDNDPEFRDQYDNVMESRLDEWEQNLHRNIKAGSDTAVIFALKTKGKGRGYVERENSGRQAVNIIEKVQKGELTVIEAGYEFAKLGLPLPEVLKIQLTRVKDQGGEDPGDYTPISEEELERRATERLAAIQKQRDEFLPERRAEVAEIKERLKDQDSFAPEKFEGAE